MKSRVQKFFYVILIGLMLLGTTRTQVYAITPTIQTHQQDADLVTDAGFAYLETQLNPDGGIRWIDENSSMAVTLRVVLALSANHFSQDKLINGSGLRPVDFLSSNGIDWVNQVDAEQPGFSVARAGQLLAAIAAGNLDPQQFGEDMIDLIYQVKLQYDPNTGVFGTATPDNVTDQVWAILGFTANNFSVPEKAALWLADAQGEDGTWNDGYGSFLDTTPIAMQALVASGYYTGDSPELQMAVNFMQNEQQPEGGWQTEWDTVTNASTTGAMLQTIAAMDELPMDSNWQNEGGNPYTATLALQQESGVIGGDYANTYSTADALIGISGKPLYKLGFLEQASRSFNFLFSLQDDDGGWGSVGQTVDVILALQAAGWQPETVLKDGSSPMDYVAANLNAYLETGPDSIGKAILGIVASDEDPSNFNNVNLIEQLMDTYDEDTQAFGDPTNTWHQAFAIIGLAAAGADVPAGAVRTLVRMQQEDGGWEYTPGFGTWPDNTSLAIQALLAAGYDASDIHITNALDYVYSLQTDDGGWGDSSTAAFVIMGLNALQDSAENWITDTGHTPLTSLMSYQKSNGSFVYSWDYPDDNVMSTASALVALFGEDYLLTSGVPGADNYAGIVIDPGEGDSQTACVSFSETSISGMDLLDATGFSYAADDGFISSIMDISNPEGETNYWSYWQWDGQAWVFNNTGVNDSNILSGTIEAWHFTSWERFPSLPPDFVPNLSDICDTTVLKNYTVEPYLNYADLFHSRPKINYPAVTQSTATEEIVPSSTQKADITSPTPTVTTQDETPTQSALPLIIIGTVGSIVLVVVILIFVKKRK